MVIIIKILYCNMMIIIKNKSRIVFGIAVSFVIGNTTLANCFVSLSAFFGQKDLPAHFNIRLSFPPSPKAATFSFSNSFVHIPIVMHLVLLSGASKTMVEVTGANILLSTFELFGLVSHAIIG